MWGKHAELEKMTGKQRITPTHVGKARMSRLSSTYLQDHPHSCGESTKQMPLNQRFCLLKIRFLITSSVNNYIITYNSECVNVSQQFYTNDSKGQLPPIKIGGL